MNRIPDNANNKMFCFQNGDKAVFEQLYDQYAPILFGIILKLTIDRKLAEQILSDCFIAAWQQKALYRSEFSFLNWLLSISRPILSAQFSSTINISSDFKRTDSHPNHFTKEGSNDPGKSIIDLALLYGMNKQEICVALQQSEKSISDSIKNTLVKTKSTTLT